MGDKKTDPALIDGIAACLDQVGGADFAEPLLAFVRGCGAQQVMVFAYEPERVRCMLSFNFCAGAQGTRLAKDYLDGWYRTDPLFSRVLGLGAGALEIADLAALAPHMDAAYRAKFFDAPSLASKAAVLVAGARLRLIVNLYWESGGGAASLSRAWLHILGRLTLLHFETVAESPFPPPLAVLSARERAVCLGILAGKKTEQIAGELDIAPSSVVTYRRRSYEKLGIAARAHLFALCRGKE